MVPPPATQIDAAGSRAIANRRFNAKHSGTPEGRSQEAPPPHRWPTIAVGVQRARSRRDFKPRTCPGHRGKSPLVWQAVEVHNGQGNQELLAAGSERSASPARLGVPCCRSGPRVPMPRPIHRVLPVPTTPGRPPIRPAAACHRMSSFATGAPAVLARKKPQTRPLPSGETRTIQ
jgi:hypothetical protein